MGTAIKSVELWCNEGKHDKVYNMQIDDLGGGKYNVLFQYGRRGTLLKGGVKASGVGLGDAEAVYDSIMAEKLGKGYKVVGGGASPVVSSPKVSKAVVFLPQLLNPIEETEVDRFIDDDDFVGQEKKDGKHVTLHRKGGVVTVTNKKGQVIDYPLTFLVGLPDEVDDVVIDGEAVGDTFWAFDLLEVCGEDLRGDGFLARFNQLEALFPALHIVPVAVGRDAKRKMYDDFKIAKREGIVFKRLMAVYSPGRPSSGGDMFKCKFYAELSARVCRVNVKRSVGVELLDGAGRWVEMGNVTIPPNKVVPKVGDVIEVRYLYCYKGGSLYQPNFKEIRDDVDEGECLMTQVKYKSEED